MRIEVNMPHDSKLQVSFSLGRNKTIYVVGEYDPTQATQTDRMEYWIIINQFGRQLSTELVENYDVKLFRVVSCEVDPGHIMFELETNASASVRRKAIEGFQQRFDEAQRAPRITYPVSGPDMLQ